MATIHDEIDNWLAADLHGELSNNERSALHAHLVDCSACRKTHQEIKVMNKILEETLAHEKPDPVFEQRMLAGFRNRVPQRSGLVNLLVSFMRLRATQIAAVAAALLGLVQIGRMITGESVTAPRERERYSRGTICCATVAGSTITRSSVGRFSQVRRSRRWPTTGFGAEGTTATGSSSVERRGTCAC